MTGISQNYSLINQYRYSGKFQRKYAFLFYSLPPHSRVTDDIRFHFTHLSSPELPPNSPHVSNSLQQKTRTFSKPHQLLTKVATFLPHSHTLLYVQVGRLAQHCHPLTMKTIIYVRNCEAKQFQFTYSQKHCPEWFLVLSDTATNSTNTSEATLPCIIWRQLEVCED